MPITCYYTCHLIPPVLLRRAGCSPRRLPLDGTARGEIGTHSTMCPYVVDLVARGEHALGTDRDAVLVVPAGCDAMRRAGDTLANAFPDQVFTLLVPRSATASATAALGRDLGRLEQWLTARSPRGSEGLSGPPIAAEGQGVSPREPATRLEPPRGTAAAEAMFDYPARFEPQGVLLIAGPLSNDGLLRFIIDRGVPISGVESCTSPDRASTLDESVGPDASIDDMARTMLTVVGCPRQESGQRRRYLARRLEQARPGVVVHARVPFCDPAAYDGLLVSALAAERGLPYLEIEVGFPFELTGPLRVRLEAFLETLMMGGGAADDLFGDDLFGDEPSGDEPSGDDFRGDDPSVVEGARSVALTAEDPSGPRPAGATG